ncbi:MAG: FMN-binding protein [Chloroflexota bacterium]
MFDKVINKQSLDIDGISGATATNKSYLKAIENALLGAGTR